MFNVVGHKLIKLIWIEFKFGDGPIHVCLFVSQNKLRVEFFDLLFAKVKIILNLNLIILINVQNQFILFVTNHGPE